MQPSLSQFLDMIPYALLGAVAVTPLLLLNMKMARRLGMIDWPKARGMTDEQIPIVGMSLVVFSSVVLIVFTYRYQLSPWVVTTAIIMGLMGYFDDRYPLSAMDKMFFQMVCAGVLVLLDPGLEQSIVQKYGAWGQLWAFLFVVGLTNAINFVDGIDGLAGLVIFVGATGFLLVGQGQGALRHYVLYSAILAGMMIPFLYLNVFKRKGFLGNVGSYFFSYLLAVMHLSIPMDVPNAITRLALSGLCFLIPLADSSMVILNRLSSLRSPFEADKGHLHHRLIQTAINLRYILLNFGIIEFAGLSVAWMLCCTRAIETSFLPVVICIALITISGILIFLIEKASKRRTQNHFLRLDAGQPIHYWKYELRNNNGKKINSLKLRRIEARVSTEIRVTDLCFVQEPNLLFILINSPQDYVAGISTRLGSIFLLEKVQATVVIDRGEFVRAPLPQHRSTIRRSA